MTTFEVKSASEVDLHRDGTPIYVQLAGLFRRRIENGEWAVGEQIPTLDMLALEFGVARATMRQTTGLLMQEGLIARYRGRGTIVLNRPQREFWYEIGADWDEMIRAYRHEGFASEILDSREAAPLPPEFVKDIAGGELSPISAGSTASPANRRRSTPSGLTKIAIARVGDAALREVPDPTAAA